MTWRFAACVLLSGCASLLPSQAQVPPGRVQGALVGEAGFARAMAAYDYPRALDVAQAWLRSDPTGVLPALAVAQASTSLADLSANDGEADGHIDRALTVLQAHIGETSAASAPSPNTGAVHFFYAEALGIRVRAQGASAIALLPTIAEHAEAAVKLAPTLDDGAPERLLAILLIKAPQWPHGPGDPERGMKMIQDVIARYPRRAEGLIHYADVLLDQSRVQEAQRYLAHAKGLIGKNPRARKLWLDVDARVTTNRGVKRYE